MKNNHVIAQMLWEQDNRDRADTSLQELEWQMLQHEYLKQADGMTKQEVAILELCDKINKLQDNVNLLWNEIKPLVRAYHLQEKRVLESNESFRGQ